PSPLTVVMHRNVDAPHYPVGHHTATRCRTAGPGPTQPTRPERSPEVNRLTITALALTAVIAAAGFAAGVAHGTSLRRPGLADAYLIGYQDGARDRDRGLAQGVTA